MRPFPAIFAPRPAADLPFLERRLEACLIELERLYQVRPSLPDALGRAGAGQRIDELLDDAHAVGAFLAPELAPDRVRQGRINPYGGLSQGMKKGGNPDISALKRIS